MLENLRLILASVYTAVFVMHMFITLLYVIFLIKGTRNINKSPYEYVFPLWLRNYNGKDVKKFSLSYFWVWLVVPNQMLLMFFIPLFPNEVTIKLSGITAFWTSSIGSIVTVLTYAFMMGKDPNSNVSMLDSIKNRLNGMNNLQVNQPPIEQKSEHPDPTI